MSIVREHHKRHLWRNEGIKAMYKAGATLAAIATHFDLTRQRVQQICKDFKLDKYNAGAAVRPTWKSATSGL
jgi:hypothetical protein